MEVWELEQPHEHNVALSWRCLILLVESTHSIQNSNSSVIPTLDFKSENSATQQYFYDFLGSNLKTKT